MYELEVESQFDSAHNLRGYDGPCECLHGHTYHIQVCYRGSELGDLDMLVDFKRLKTALSDVVSYLDHCYLNDLPEFHDVNPTAERIARYVFETMRAKVGNGISKAKVWETPTSAASYWADE